MFFTVNKQHSIKFITAILTAVILSGCGESKTDTEYLAQAREFQQQNNLNASVIELKNALNVNPDNIEARLLLGEIYLDIGLNPAAEKELRRATVLGLALEAVVVPLARALLQQGEFQEVLDLDVDNSALDSKVVATVLALQGHARLGLNEPEEAARTYEKVQKINPDEPEVYRGLAMLAISNGDLETARQLLDKALEVDPTFAAAWSLSGDLARREGHVGKAETYYGKTIANQELNLDVRLKRALVRTLLGKYKEASEDIAYIRKRTGQNAGTEYAQGLILFHEGEYREAQIAFERALSRQENYMPAVFYLGVTHYLQGNAAQARTYIGRYAGKFPNNIRAQHLMAVIEIHNNDLDDARRRLARILPLQPDNLQTLKLLTEVSLKAGDTDKSIEYMQKVVALEPDVANSRLRLGLGLIMEGEDESGVLELEKAVELDSDFKLVEFVLVLNEMRQGTPEEAVRAAEAFTRKQPESPMAWNLLGLVQLKANQIDAARRSFEQALEIVPGEPGAANNLAQLALRRGDIEEAVRLYESVLEKRPGQIPTLVQLVKLKTRQGRLTEAQELLEEKVKAYPDELEPRVLLADIYSKQGDSARAVALMFEAKDELSGHPVYLGMLGELQLQSGDYANAAHSLEQLVKLAPRSGQAYQKLCEVYYQGGDLGKLEPALERTLALSPQHLPTRIMKLKLLIQTNRLDAAMRLLKELQTDYPTHPELFVLQARLALAQKRPSDAILAYQEAVKRVPDRDLVGQLALAQWQAGQRQAAVQTMKEWLAENPDDMVVQYNLANLYLAGNMHDEARTAFARVIEKYPEHPLALSNLAALTRQTDPGKALKYAERAYKQAPDSPVVQDVLAQVLLDHSEVKRAIHLLERAVEQAPGNMNIRFHWARALADNGEKEQAKQELIRILGEGKWFAGEQEARLLLEKLSQESG